MQHGAESPNCSLNWGRRRNRNGVSITGTNLDTSDIAADQSED
jgi:hypothetical protein